MAHSADVLTPALRLALAIISFALGAYLLVANDYAGLLFIVASAYLAYGHFRYGSVWLAFRDVAHGRMDAAAKRLSRIKQPELLGAEQRAYFELASGLVGASRGQNERAEAHLKASLEHSLGTDNDRALAEAVLAQLLVARGELVEARGVVDAAAKRACRPSIAARIKALQQELVESEEPGAK